MGFNFKQKRAQSREFINRKKRNIEKRSSTFFRTRKSETLIIDFYSDNRIKFLLQRDSNQPTRAF